MRHELDHRIAGLHPFALLCDRHGDDAVEGGQDREAIERHLSGVHLGFLGFGGQLGVSTSSLLFSMLNLALSHSYCFCRISSSETARSWLSLTISRISYSAVSATSAAADRIRRSTVAFGQLLGDLVVESLDVVQGLGFAIVDGGQDPCPS